MAVLAHQLTAVALFQIDEADAIKILEAVTGVRVVAQRINLNPANLMSVSVGCYRCEEALDVALMLSPCPGEPEG